MAKLELKNELDTNNQYIIQYRFESLILGMKKIVQVFWIMDIFLILFLLLCLNREGYEEFFSYYSNNITIL